MRTLQVCFIGLVQDSFGDEWQRKNEQLHFHCYGFIHRVQALLTLLDVYFILFCPQLWAANASIRFLSRSSHSLSCFLGEDHPDTLQEITGIKFWSATCQQATRHKQLNKVQRLSTTSRIPPQDARTLVSWRNLYLSELTGLIWRETVVAALSGSCRSTGFACESSQFKLKSPPTSQA